MDTLIPYMRQSRKRERTISIDEQRREIHKVQGVRLSDEIIEQNVSGSRPWRERGIGAAIAACERGEADGIIVAYQDRLSRENGLATAEVWDALDKAGARLICVNDGIDTATGDHELTFQIKAAIARDQWKRYAHRFESAKRNAVERGLHIGRAPFGYIHPGTAQPFVLDPKAARAVRAAFELRASGGTAGDVRRMLDRRAPGGATRKGAWKASTVRRLLMNRVYVGEVRDGLGNVKQGAHPAIVDEALFDTVQALMRHSEPQRSHIHAAQARMLLAGVVQCGSCGYALARKISGGYETYACHGTSASGPCPNRVTVMAANLDAYVEEIVVGRLVAQAATIERRRIRKDAAPIHTKLAAARAKRDLFADPDYVAQLGLDAAKRGLTKVDDEIDSLERELVEAVGAGTDTDGLVVIPTADAFRSLPVEDRRKVIQAAIVAVTVYPSLGRKRGTPLDERVKITWLGGTPPIARPATTPFRNRTEVIAGLAPSKRRAKRRKPGGGNRVAA